MQIKEKKHLWWLSTSENIAKEQVNLLFKQAKTANYTVIISSVLVCILFVQNYSFIPLISWTVVMISMCFIRLIIVIKQVGAKNLDNYTRLYFITTCLIGCLWSLLPLMYFDEGFVRYTLIIIVLTIGASGIVILSSVLLLTPGYIIPPILTLAYAFYTQGIGNEQYIAYFLILIIIPLLIRSAVNYNSYLLYALEMAEHLEDIVSQRTVELQLSKQEAIIAKEKAEDANQKLKILANTDPLTGINNRGYFMKLGTKLFDIAVRNKTPLQILSLDLDHFKSINDSYGHQAGDQVLKQFTKSIDNLLRGSDLFGRVGGEEFCILLQSTKIEGAEIFAERLRKSIESMKIILDEKIIEVTVSIGLVTLTDEVNINSLLKKSDIALYNAKNSGRNQIFTIR